jgi:hypothetical protein
MNNPKFTAYRLGSHRSKIISFYFTLAFILITALILIFDFGILSFYEPSQILIIGLSLSSMGLVSISMSKEKVEDERVKIIRAKALQIAYVFIMIPILGTSLSSALYKVENVTIDGIIGIVFIGLLIQNIYFHYNIKNDSEFNYDDEEGSFKQNMNSKTGKIFNGALLTLFVISVIVYILTRNS